MGFASYNRKSQIEKSKKIFDDEKVSSNVDERYFRFDYKKNESIEGNPIVVRLLPSKDFEQGDSNFTKSDAIWYDLLLGGKIVEECPIAHGLRKYGEGRDNRSPLMKFENHLWDAIKNNKFVKDHVVSVNGKDIKPWNELQSRCGRFSTKDNPYHKANKYNICNMLVIDDKYNPSNNGKVFLFKVPKVINDKIEELVKWGDDPFDPSENGYLLFLEYKVEKFPEFDKSAFIPLDKVKNKYGEKYTSSQLMENAFNQLYSIKSIHDEIIAKVKSDAELQDIVDNKLIPDLNKFVALVTGNSHTSSAAIPQNQNEVYTPGKSDDSFKADTKNAQVSTIEGIMGKNTSTYIDDDIPF